jgi:hypothetical protein
MRLISRTPDKANCRVRGIGVAVKVSTCTSAFNCFNFLFLRDTEMLLLVDDQEAQMSEPDVVGQQRVGADHGVEPTLFF